MPGKARTNSKQADSAPENGDLKNRLRDLFTSLPPLEPDVRPNGRPSSRSSSPGPVGKTLLPQWEPITVSGKVLFTNQLHLAFEKVAAGMLLVGMDGRLVSVNQAFCQMLGCSPGGLAGLNLQDLIHPQDLHAVTLALRRMLLSAGRSSRFEVRLRHKSEGEWIWAECNISLTHGKSCKPAYFILVALDVSEQHATRALLARRIRELDCLNDISQIMDQRLQPPHFFSWLTARLPAAFQHPELCLAAVEYQGTLFGSQNALVQTSKMIQELHLGGQAVGRIHLTYLEPLPFIDAETALLATIASRVSGYLEILRLESEFARLDEFPVTIINDPPAGCLRSSAEMHITSPEPPSPHKVTHTDPPPGAEALIYPQTDSPAKRSRSTAEVQITSPETPRPHEATFGDPDLLSETAIDSLKDPLAGRAGPADLTPAAATRPPDPAQQDAPPSVTLSGQNGVGFFLSSWLRPSLRPSRVPFTVYLLLYLLAIALAEVLTAYAAPQLGLILHGTLLVLMMIHSSLAATRQEQKFLFTLVLAPLIRLLSLSMPLLEFDFSNWYLVIGAPLFISVLLVYRLTGYQPQDVGLSLGTGVFWQMVIATTGLIFGYLEFRILKPEPLVESLTLQNVWLPVLILLVFTGFLEELIFRGLMQRASKDTLYRLGPVYISILFAVLHIGYRSLTDFVFVLLVGLFFSLVVERTRSILGVTLAHGLTNITLFLIFPFLPV
jgi:hypothetical protein